MNFAIKRATRQRVRPGRVFSKLTVLARDAGQSMWLCRCECGEQKSVRSDHLQNGATSSCGCVRFGMLKSGLRTIHGEAKRSGKSREWSKWQGMIHRCYDPAEESYPRYGGRGIKVCDRWLHSFENFLSDMGRCPDGLTIERNNNDGNYEPSNCRWATRVEQCNNRSSNRLVTANGATKTLAQWARLSGISASVIITRIKRGWEPELAIAKPVLSGGMA